MAKKMTFADKAAKRAFTMTCPVCSEAIQYIKYVRAVKGDNGSQFGPNPTGLDNRSEIYG